MTLAGMTVCVPAARGAAALALLALGVLTGGAASASGFAEREDEPPKVTLGRALFFDTSLSHPVGQSCASCHAPEAGFRFPDSRTNRDFGVATGAIRSRVTSRAVPTISYASFIPDGPIAQPRPFNPAAGNEMLFIGGQFWDGHASNLVEQAQRPFFHPNEMNLRVHNLPSPGLLADKLARSPEAPLFRQVYGGAVFQGPAQTVLEAVADAIAEYERSREVSPFTSKYDAYLAGQYTFTPAELDGLRLVTGTFNGRPGGPPYHKFAQCILCHGISQDPAIGYPDLWTNFCYANIGTPRNPRNPFYAQTNPHADPGGSNPDGQAFIDFGLGGFIYPGMGLPVGNLGPGGTGDGDFLAINGAFKAPTLRNVDKRPRPGFIKAYMHNGSFRGLEEIVHFYNTRNLTTVPGEVIDFTRTDPYTGLKGTPLWPPPELSSPDSLTNPAGDPPEKGGQVGNLGLTPLEENHIVQFLRTLTDR